ncbi:hypothetical protein [Methylocapsa sp. S129]|uniref:hypothetical protein n=1 Tax=Methylocapsa sp. S129 TaxID=1641869 RepID=UPI00131E1C5C|nr:hypothetical protein [Methylocapsa sp. S129]
MADKTIAERARRQRGVRLTEGWQEVKVWVPTEADAEDVRKLAAERRKRAEALHGLSKEVPMIDMNTELRIAKAISEQGSAAYTTESGAVLELMTHLADEDDLQGLSRAFVILARAKPPNAAFVAARVPAKISNFLIKHRGINPIALLKWTSAYPAWVEDLKDAVRDPVRFEQVVEAMATAINQAAATN